LLFLKSPYPWVQSPHQTPSFRLTVKRNQCAGRVDTAAGPVPPSFPLNACVIDPWGLSQVRFEINPVKLVVIPRARYADYLARKYLSGSRFGRLPLVSSVGTIRSLYGLRQGIEFYGNRIVPTRRQSEGNNRLETLRKNTTNWLPRKFLNSGTARHSPESTWSRPIWKKTDKLAYNIIAAALSLAQDGIPTRPGSLR